jgi:geranyl-CoA carboxylase beta subunit
VVTVLHGASAAGGAYMPGMSDYVVGVKDNGKAYLAGPALLKAATGEVADDAELGGSAMHARYRAWWSISPRTMRTGCRSAATWWHSWTGTGTGRPARRRGLRRAPVPPEELLGVVPRTTASPTTPARSWRASSMVPCSWSSSPLTERRCCACRPRCTVMPVGIVCNNGPIDPDGAAKAAQFIQLCDQARTPLLFLQNITGYMVGTASEQAGMIKHGAKMIQAVTNVRVPRITLMIGASFGAGNYGMCGQGYDPDFLFSWPNTRSA